MTHVQTTLVTALRQGCLGGILFVLLASIASAQGPAIPPATIDFAGVTDNTPVEHGDTQAYYALLDLAQQSEPPALRSAALDFVRRQWQQSKYQSRPESEFPLFYDMLTQPEIYRGQSVLLRGHILRVDSYAAGPNPYGIQTLYECWLVTEDSQNHPATIVFLDKPPQLAIGEELVDGIEVSGYFLKVYTYPSLDQRVRKAPLILARTITLRNPPTVSAAPAVRWGFAILCGFALLLCAVACVTRINQRRLQQIRKQVLTAPAPDFSNLKYDLLHVFRTVEWLILEGTRRACRCRSRWQ